MSFIVEGLRTTAPILTYLIFKCKKQFNYNGFVCSKIQIILNVGCVRISFITNASKAYYTDYTLWIANAKTVKLSEDDWIWNNISDINEEGCWSMRFNVIRAKGN